MTTKKGNLMFNMFLGGLPRLSVLGRLKLPILILTVVLCVLFSNRVYARDVRVFFDGKEITYDVPAQIINGFTMVPLSQTLEAMTGSGTIYNASTGSSAFYVNGHKHVHTLGTNVLYVDGTAKYFEASSVVLDGRALVPLRMIVDSCNLDYYWDDINYHVQIATPTDDSAGNQVLVPDALPANIISFKSSTSVVTLGDPLTLTATTNSYASEVWVNDGREKRSMTLDAQTEAGGIKTWTLTYYITDKSNLAVYAKAPQTSAVEFPKKLEISIFRKPPSIESAVLDKTAIKHGESVTVTVNTNVSAEFVWIESINGRVNASLVSGDPAGPKIWTATFYPTGSQRIRVLANSTQAAEGAVSRSFDIKMSQPAVIHGADVNSVTLPLPSYIHVILTVRTNIEANYVWVRANGVLTDAMHSYTDDSGVKFWVVGVYPGSDYRLEILANSVNTTAGAVTYLQNITVSNYVTIINAMAIPSDLTVDQTTQINVETNSAANYVNVQTDTGLISCSYAYTNTAGNKVWNVLYTAGNKGVFTFTAYAGNYFGSPEAVTGFGVRVN